MERDMQWILYIIVIYRIAGIFGGGLCLVK